MLLCFNQERIKIKRVSPPSRPCSQGKSLCYFSIPKSQKGPEIANHTGDYIHEESLIQFTRIFTLINHPRNTFGVEPAKELSTRSKIKRDCSSNKALFNSVTLHPLLVVTCFACFLFRFSQFCNVGNQESHSLLFSF